MTRTTILCGSLALAFADIFATVYFQHTWAAGVFGVLGALSVGLMLATVTEGGAE